MNKRQLSTTKFIEKNHMGQEEVWLNPIDAINNPAHSKIICKFGDKIFIEKNLKKLINGKNEYYPHLGGSCLCGSCNCG